jgi:hypothetical protein
MATTAAAAAGPGPGSGGGPPVWKGPTFNNLLHHPGYATCTICPVIAEGEIIGAYTVRVDTIRLLISDVVGCQDRLGTNNNTGGIECNSVQLCERF